MVSVGYAFSTERRKQPLYHLCHAASDRAKFVRVQRAEHRKEQTKHAFDIQLVKASDLKPLNVEGEATTWPNKCTSRPEEKTKTSQQPDLIVPIMVARKRVVPANTRLFQAHLDLAPPWRR